MEIARAREILDPEHREPYESLEPINEACRMGVEALRRRVPESPYPDGDAGVMACPSCGSGEYLHNEDGNRCRFCGQCGQAIDWDGSPRLLFPSEDAVREYQEREELKEWVRVAAGWDKIGRYTLEQLRAVKKILEG